MIALQWRQPHYCRVRRNNLPAAVIAQRPVGPRRGFPRPGTGKMRRTLWPAVVRDHEAPVPSEPVVRGPPHPTRVPNARLRGAPPTAPHATSCRPPAPYADRHPLLVIVAMVMMVVVMVVMMMTVIVDRLITGRLISLRTRILPAHVVHMQQLCGIRYGFQQVSVRGRLQGVRCASRLHQTRSDGG